MWAKTQQSFDTVEELVENAVVAGCPARVIKQRDAGTNQKTALESALRKL